MQLKDNSKNVKKKKKKTSSVECGYDVHVLTTSFILIENRKNMVRSHFYRQCNIPPPVSNERAWYLFIYLTKYLILHHINLHDEWRGIFTLSPMSLIDTESLTNYLKWISLNSQMH